MSIRAKGTLLASLAGLSLAVGIAWSLRGSWTSSGLGFSPEEIRGLIQDRRYDEAESRLLSDLSRAPERPEAHLLMAISSLSRPRPRPDVALDHLRRIRDSPDLLAGIRLNEAKAYYSLDLFDKAEVAWLDGLRHESARAEAGSNLLGLYYLQGRSRDARRLALRLHERESDPRQRVLWLLELVRQDAQPLEPESQVGLLEPVVRKNPGDVRTAVALATYYARASRAEEGVAILRRVIDAHPDDRQSWLALLDALDDSARKAELEQTLDRLPAELAGDPWIDYYRGQVAEAERDWPSAERLYRQAREVDPHHPELCYRLGHLLRRTGDRVEGEQLVRSTRERESASLQARPLFREAVAIAKLGVEPHPGLYQRIAETRERLGHYDEALAWHRLALRDLPDDPLSLDAVKRLAGDPRADPLAPPGGERRR